MITTKLQYLHDNPQVEDALEAAEAEGVTAYITDGLKHQQLAVCGNEGMAVVYPLQDGTWCMHKTSPDALMSGSDEALDLKEYPSFGEAFADALDMVNVEVPGYNASEGLRPVE